MVRKKYVPVILGHPVVSTAGNPNWRILIADALNHYG